MEVSKSAFEVFPYDRKQPAISLRPRGQISLNSAAFSVLERPEAVLLLFDAKTRRIAIKRGSPSDERTYPVNKHRKNNPAIPASKFLKHYDIDIHETIRYNAELEGEMLVVKL